MLDFETSKSNMRSRNQTHGEKKILKNYFTSEGAVSHNVLYNQQFQQCPLPLKGRYTFGNCQRTVFSLGVSQQKHKITSLWKFGLNRSTKLRENDERNNTLVGRICVLSDGNNFHCCIFLVTGIQLLFAYPENHVEIMLVILFLSRQKFHAKQIFVLSSSMKLGQDESTYCATGSWCCRGRVSTVNLLSEPWYLVNRLPYTDLLHLRLEGSL